MMGSGEARYVSPSCHCNQVNCCFFFLSTATSGGAEDHAVRIPEIAGHSRGRRECRGTRAADCKAWSLHLLFLLIFSYSSSNNMDLVWICRLPDTKRSTRRLKSTSVAFGRVCPTQRVRYRRRLKGQRCQPMQRMLQQPQPRPCTSLQRPARRPARPPPQPYPVLQRSPPGRCLGARQKSAVQQAAPRVSRRRQAMRRTSGAALSECWR